MAAQFVQRVSAYFGFTEAELLIELARYKAARQTSHSDLTSSSINGQSFDFGDRHDGSLDDWSNALQAALYELNPDKYDCPPPSHRSVGRLY